MSSIFYIQSQKTGPAVKSDSLYICSPEKTAHQPRIDLLSAEKCRFFIFLPLKQALRLVQWSIAAAHLVMAILGLAWVVAAVIIL
jgi:hypothetical protein